LKKNEEYTVIIEDMSVEGAGVGKVGGVPVFVKDALIGDEVRIGITKVKKNYAFARVIEIIRPSADRVEPVCSFARACGGCQIQQLSYEKQLAFKEIKVRNNLERIGGIKQPPMKPIIGMDEPFHYRNKAQFPVGTDKNGNPIAGFYAGRTHSIIANTDCALGVAVNQPILETVLAHMKKYGIPAYDETTGEGLLRHVMIRYGFTSKEIMVCLVINGKMFPYAQELVDELCRFDGMKSITLNINQKNTNVILGSELVTLWGEAYIQDEIDGIVFRISPLSFYQVNPVQTSKLYGKALEYAQLTGEETVWDLYCGIGTISLFLARQAKKVYGVEIIPEAIEDAKNNARLNKITNAEFFVGRSEEVLPAYYADTNETADVIVVDPPRKGCDETLLDTIVKMQPNRVVYVSCDSATLARDLRYLTAHGYRLEEVTPVDMFPGTVHVETVVKLSEQKTDDTIE
jgi:23S rRNA (uracil1939-C5)-methyltransferase